MAKIKVGVAGYGTIGQRLADGVALQGDMELVGVADLAPTLAIRALYEKVAVGIIDICDCMETIYRELEGKINSDYSSTLECGTDGNAEEKGREV